MKARLLILVISALLAATIIVGLIFISSKRNNRKGVGSNITKNSSKVSSQPDVVNRPLSEKPVEPNLPTPPSDKQNSSLSTEGIVEVKENEVFDTLITSDSKTSEDTSATSAAGDSNSSSSTSTTIDHTSASSESGIPNSLPSTSTFEVPSVSSSSALASVDNIPTIKSESKEESLIASEPLNQLQLNERLRQVIRRYFQNPKEQNILNALEDAKKGTSIEDANKQTVDRFYLDTYKAYHADHATAIFEAVYNGKSHEEALALFDKVASAYTSMRALGYSPVEPKYPDILFHNIRDRILREGWKLPDTAIGNASIKQGLDRIFTYVETHPPADSDLIDTNKQEIRETIQETLGELISYFQVKALSNRTASDSIEAVVDKTHKELHKIIHVYGFSADDIKSVATGFSATMTSAEILDLLRERLFPPKLTWGTSLVSDGIPRPLKNNNAICYANGTLQCFANFLPLWKMTAMKEFTRNVANADKFTTRFDQVLELLNQATDVVLDVTQHLTLKSWDNTREYIKNIYHDFELESLIPKRNLNDFSSVVTSGHRNLDYHPIYSQPCFESHWRFPCACGEDSFEITLGGLALFDKHATLGAGTYEVPLTTQFLDLETGRYNRHDLYAFTFGRNLENDANIRGHTYAYVKRRNGKWYFCNDSRVEEVAEDQVPITKALQEHHGKRPLVLFYLRME